MEHYQGTLEPQFGQCYSRQPRSGQRYHFNVDASNTVVAHMYSSIGEVVKRRSRQFVNDRYLYYLFISNQLLLFTFSPRSPGRRPSSCRPRRGPGGTSSSPCRSRCPSSRRWSRQRSPVSTSTGSSTPPGSSCSPGTSRHAPPSNR